MFITFKALLHLPVYTVSGARLGRVLDVELESETHQVRHYVAAAGFFAGARYLIAPRQVRAISLEKMVVDDTVSAITDATRVKERRSHPMLEGVAPTSTDTE